MADEYDRDWIFIIKRLQNEFNVLEKQICVYINDTVLFDPTGKLSTLITMNTKPFLAFIKQVENPSIHQVNRLLSSKHPGRFLDLPDELEEPVTALSSIPTSPLKRRKSNNDKSNLTLDNSDDKKELREQRDRERNNWRVYQTRVGVSKDW